MSVIAWDGLRLAADKRVSLGTLIRTGTKVFRVGEALVAYAGDADAGEEMMAWFEGGRDPDKFPSFQRNNDTWGGLLVVWGDGSLWKYERTPHPIRFPPQTFAIGSGRDFALAAMHLGKSAPEAVEIACLFDSGCGNGVDVFVHNTSKVNDI